jgi:membrane protease YdiL (CAAX protease family)
MPAQRPPVLEQVAKATTELLLLVLSGFAGVAVLMVLTALRILPDVESAPWSAVLAGPILIGSAGLNYLMIERALGRDSDPPRPIEPMDGRRPAGVLTGMLIAIGAVVLSILGSVLLALAQELVLSTEVEEQQVFLDLVARGDPFELGMLSLSAVILAPLTEELLFRHMFFRRLLQRAGPLAAWTLPALAFALAHWNPVGLLVYVWLGTVFAMAYALSGRLWVAVLTHAGHNAFALTMLLYAPEVLP